MIVLWTGGQSGVDMGAARTALAMGVEVGGYMPADGHNEDGPIPDAVAMHLRRHDRTDPAARTRANVATCGAALVIVEDYRRAGATRGTALTIRLSERELEPAMRLVVDPTWHDESVAAWAERAIAAWGRRSSPLRLMVAGPRRSSWPDGEREAARFVRAILEAARG